MKRKFQRIGPSIENRSIAFGSMSKCGGVIYLRRRGAQQETASKVNSVSPEARKVKAVKHLENECLRPLNVRSFIHNRINGLFVRIPSIFRKEILIEIIHPLFCRLEFDIFSNGMAADDPLCQEPLVSVEFEVFGKVQGVYFPKYVRDICLQLKICGWVKNSKTGTILGKMQGPRGLVDQMAQWLTSVGSPGSEIHHCEFTNWETVTKQQYQGFVIRF